MEKMSQTYYLKLFNSSIPAWFYWILKARRLKKSRSEGLSWYPPHASWNTSHTLDYLDEHFFLYVPELFFSLLSSCRMKLLQECQYHYFQCQCLFLFLFLASLRAGFFFQRMHRKSPSILGTPLRCQLRTSNTFSYSFMHHCLPVFFLFCFEAVCTAL